MSGFAELVASDRRQLMLHFLAGAAGYSLNSGVLHEALNSFSGIACSRDCVDTECAWLEEQGLVTTERLEQMTLVRLTQRGLDVALGRARVPGVKRPDPPRSV